MTHRKWKLCNLCKTFHTKVDWIFYFFFPWHFINKVLAGALIQWHCCNTPLVLGIACAEFACSPHVRELSPSGTLTSSHNTIAFILVWDCPVSLWIWESCDKAVGLCISITEANAIHISMYYQWSDTYDITINVLLYNSPLLRCSAIWHNQRHTLMQNNSIWYK